MSASRTVLKLITKSGGNAPSPASAKILDANSRRLYCEIINASDTGQWIMLGAPAVVGSGIYIAPNGFSYVMNSENMWLGEVHMICASATKAYGVIEGQ